MGSYDKKLLEKLFSKNPLNIYQLKNDILNFLFYTHTNSVSNEVLVT